MVSSVNNNSNSVHFSDFQKLGYVDELDTSIFEATADDTSVSDANVSLLEQQLDAVDDKQGVFSKAWNGIKEKTGIGTSSAKCDEAIDAYKKGEITFEEASAKIDEYAQKQESSLNLFSNIATSIAAIGSVAAAAAIVVASGGTALPAVAAIGIGAGAGAATKVGFKMTDRATNEIDGDAANGKQIAKDALSGAVTGGIAAYSMGTAGCATTAAKEAATQGSKEAAKIGVKTAVKECAKTGVKTGAISGGSNYTIDCAFDKDKKFNIKDFAITTAENAAVGGAVGATMGGFNGALRTTGVLKSGCGNSVMAAGKGTVKDVAANSVCTAEYKILNDRIRSVAA